MGEEPRRRVTAIDGVRVLAMLAVVVYHANSSWLPGGFLGVTIFFAISGYLITDGLLRELRRSGSVDIARFYRRRLARLVPQMVLVVAVTALLCAIFAPQLLAKMRGDAVSALLFFENWWFIVREQSYFAASGLPSPITHFWFISVLMQFYLAWPLVLAVLSRILPSRTAQRRVVAVLAVISAVAAALLYDPRADPSRVYYGTDTRLAEILVGAWAAYAFPTDGITSFAKGLLRRMPALRSWVVTDLIGLGALAALVALMLNMNGYSTFLYRGGLFLVAVLASTLVVCIARPESLLAKPLGCPPLVALSARTFGIYLWHYPLLLIMNPATRTTELPWWGWLLEALAIAAAVELSYHFIERPFAQIIDGLGRSDRGREAPRARDTIPYLGALGIACAVAAVLLIVGPFWYVDGATAQQAQTSDVAPGGQASDDGTDQAQQVVPAETDVVDDSTPAEATAVDIAATLAEHGRISGTIRVAKALIANEKARLEQEAIEAEKAHTGNYEVNADTGATDAPVLLIGDSVPAGAIDAFREIFPYGIIDAEVGRQLYSAVDVYRSYLDGGDDHHVVVFSSGDNGVAQAEDVRAFIDAAGPNRQVYLVTVRVPLPLQDMNNELFYAIADEYDNVEVIDWYAESAGHDEYFWDDGTHLRPEGAEAYVLMLRRAICGQ